VPSIAVRLASDEYDDLKKYAMSKNMTTSEVVRNAIFFTRFMDELQTSELLNGFMRSKIIDTVMQDMKISLEKRLRSKEFQAELKEYLPQLQEKAVQLAENIKKIAPYKKRRGRPPLLKTTLGSEMLPRRRE